MMFVVAIEVEVGVVVDIADEGEAAVDVPSGRELGASCQRRHGGRRGGSGGGG